MTLKSCFCNSKLLHLSYFPGYAIKKCWEDDMNSESGSKLSTLRYRCACWTGLLSDSRKFTVSIAVYRKSIIRKFCFRHAARHPQYTNTARRIHRVESSGSELDFPTLVNPVVTKRPVENFCHAVVGLLR